MTQLTIQVRNAELVGKGLANIRAEVPRISERTIENGAQAIAKRMRIYPAAPSGSRYVRTYRLRDSVKVKRMASGYAVSIDPVSKRGTRYGRYVIGFADGSGQARQNSHWRLLRDVTEEEVEKLPPMVEEHIRLVARSEGLA